MDKSKWVDYFREFCRGTLFVSGVYSFMNVKSRRFYVGESSNVGLRVIDHINSLRKGTHNRRQANEDARVYGVESFELFLVEAIEGEKERREAEIRVTQAIDHREGLSLYSDHHIAVNKYNEKRYPISDEQIREVVRLKASGKSYTEIAKKCNKDWGYDYSHGNYHRMVRNA